MPLRTFWIILYLAFFGGAIGVLGKFALPALRPETLIFVRLAISIACFAAVLCWQKKFGDALRALREHFFIFCALAASGIGGGMILGFIGLSQTTAINYDLLFNMSALFIVGFSMLLLKEPLRARDALLLLLALFGALLITTNGFALTPTAINWRGDLLVLCGAIGWALYSVLGPRFARAHSDVDPITILFNTFVVGALFLLPYVLGRGGFTPSLLDFRTTIAALALGIFSTAILFYLWLEFVRTSTGLLGSFVTLGENISGFILPILFLGEQPGLAIWIGSALIVGAIIFKKKSIASQPSLP